ncbi:MAG: SprT-like domain-containing protein [Bacteroidota bacterium]|nr:SprT-like domain-containing protein [Bacteroidota bacterium]
MAKYKNTKLESMEDFLPEGAWPFVRTLIAAHKVHIIIMPERKRKHGDYKKLPVGDAYHHEITINESLNPYGFLLTLIHEIAHLYAFIDHTGKAIAPHGTEWKTTFTKLMTPIIDAHIYPQPLAGILRLHMKNPKATSGSDMALQLALKKYDPVNENESHIIYMDSMQVGSKFYYSQIKADFVVIEKLRKRYKCKDLKTGKLYLFSPMAEVIPLSQ